MTDLKRKPGRPRLHDPDKWTSVQFRLPLILRQELFRLLEERNKTLPYRLSLNCFLLELIQYALKNAMHQMDKDEKSLE